METIGMKSAISLTGIVLLGAMVAFGQSSDPWGDLPRDRAHRGVAVRGQVSSETTFAGTLTVELLEGGHSLSASTYLHPDGSFEFASVSPGTYELRIAGGSGTVVYHQTVMINGPEPNLSISIPARPNAGSSSGGTISIRQLQHKVPREARKEFDKGVAASRKSDHSGAVEHFQKAVSIDPELADGYNNLGSAYAALGQLEQAAEQYQKTIDLVPEHTLALANLSVTLCKLKQYSDAERVARRALKLDSGLLKIRYILAVSLIAQHGNNAEALENLQRASTEVPKARLVAADILAQAGRRDDAAKQLEDYLHSVPEQDTDRQRVGEWLAQLRLPPN
jgi:tetratricopeptide (TPR) repeat protein